MNTCLNRSYALFLGLLSLGLSDLQAQNSTRGEVTESGTRLKTTPQFKESPFHREPQADRPVLEHAYVHERDVLWEKRVWREIPLDELMNQYFMYEKEPLMKILLSAAECERINLYREESFDTELTYHEAMAAFAKEDTVPVFNPETFETDYQIVRNEFNWRNVKRFRIKESWYFDSKYSKLNVRILGIAPIAEVRDPETNALIAEMPMFWVYYPDARYVLAEHRVFNGANDNAPMSWEDALEMRYFASYITKESNVHDRRIKDYKKEGHQALVEADKIHESIRNYESDLWEY